MPIIGRDSTKQEYRSPCLIKGWYIPPCPKRPVWTFLLPKGTIWQCEYCKNKFILRKYDSIGTENGWANYKES